MFCVDTYHVVLLVSYIWYVWIVYETIQLWYDIYICYDMWMDDNSYSMMFDDMFEIGFEKDAINVM